jgi:hypothetical protein
MQGARCRHLLRLASLDAGDGPEESPLGRFCQDAPQQPVPHRERNKPKGHKSFAISITQGQKKTLVVINKGGAICEFRGVTRRSNRPARSKAGSRTSTRLVAAMQMTRLSLLLSNPSSSVSSWLRVCSRSSLPTDRSLVSRPWRFAAQTSSTKRGCAVSHKTRSNGRSFTQRAAASRK